MVAVACPGVRTRHALLGLIVAVGLTACGDDDDGQESADVTAAAGCADVDLPAPGDDGGATVPTDTLDPAQTWTLTFDTSCGTFVVTLDLDSAPEHRRLARRPRRVRVL
jgi:hypothetical protein